MFTHKLSWFSVTNNQGVLSNEGIVLPTALKPMMAIFLDFAGMTDSNSSSRQRRS